MIPTPKLIDTSRLEKVDVTRCLGTIYIYRYPHSEDDSIMDE